VKIQAQLAQDYPGVPLYRRLLAASHNNLGIALVDQGKRAEAETAYRGALKIQAQLNRDFAAVPEYGQDLGHTHHNLGNLLAAMGKRADAETAFREALKIQTQLAQDFPSVPAFRNDLAETMVDEAILLRQGKELGPARRLLEEAVPHHRAALRASPENREYRQGFRINRENLADILVEMEEHAAAAEIVRELIQAAVDPGTDIYNAACILARCVPLAKRDSRLSESQRKERAQAYADRALATLRQAVHHGYNDAAHVKKDTDLDPLRSYPEFQKLLKELQAKVEPKRK
jgi:tetratricopeptide (TPR) repeat protein